MLRNTDESGPKMRFRIITALLLVSIQGVRAQTADDYIDQGRFSLKAANIIAAHNSFSNALVLSPNHQSANAFYAATRLLVLPYRPAGSNFLNRLGFPAEGRDIYSWTALIPSDTNGVPLAPDGVSTSESTLLLRTSILPELLAAEANLAKVSDTNFTITLASNETQIAVVTLDYGDVQMLRAMLQFAVYGSYTAYSWNLDASLTALRSLYTDNQLSAERVLRDYPGLLTFATTNDLNAAKIAFTTVADRYFEASRIIRSRSTNVVRLFNYDETQAANEEMFRFTLIDLKNSLNGPVTLTADSRYTVSLGAHFSGGHAPRSFLPAFSGNAFVLGSLPDPTFGGLIAGISSDEAEEFLANYLVPVPTIWNAYVADQQFHFSINTLTGRWYAVQVSTNLLNWSDHAVFFALGGTYDFTDSINFGFERRYYRVEDWLGTVTNPTPPNFAGIPTNGLAPLTVLFTNLSSGAANCNWDFGDGNTSAGVNHPANTYANAGSYTVTLTAVGVGGTNSLTRTNYIVVALNPTNNPALTNMALIPAGSFTMGNSLSPNEGWSDELPAHAVYVSAFYMDRYEVTKALWDEVYQWATNHGYSFANPGSGKAANHPVHSINWYDMVKWCNARSQQEGLTPCYYKEAGLTTVYKTGTGTPYPKWNGGYRLPTEAEWEKAARGGAGGHRFPWADADTISWSRANYYAYPSGNAYDVNPTQGNNPTFNDGVQPYTSPVGYFAPNGHGLYDMAGNVWELCWDRYDGSWYSNAGATQSDTRGPIGTSSSRVLRGGSWYHTSNGPRCAVRANANAGGPAASSYGFRCVLSTGQP